MPYSSIVRKKCKCGCNRYPTLGYAGYSYGCAPQELKDKIGTKKQVAARNKANKNALSRKLHQEQNIVYNHDLEKWFETVKLENTVSAINGNRGGCACWNCGEWIPLGYIRHATAHIIAKRLCPSVATHPNNFLILGAGCGCHQLYDRTWEDARKMKVFTEAKIRFQTFVHLIPISQSRFIPEQLIDTNG